MKTTRSAGELEADTLSPSLQETRVCKKTGLVCKLDGGRNSFAGRQIRQQSRRDCKKCAQAVGVAGNGFAVPSTASRQPVLKFWASRPEHRASATKIRKRFELLEKISDREVAVMISAKLVAEYRTKVVDWSRAKDYLRARSIRPL